ncbi:MAG: anthrone oxygenase family protein [Pyrinomonadaceae bacterium]
MILRKVVLFFTAVLVALTAGRAFWVWLGENPANLSGATYVEFFQVLDRGIALPIAVTGIGGAVLAGISAILFRRDRPAFYLLLATCGLALLATIVTISVHLPINARVATWNPTALPPNYRDFLDQWWKWQQVRLVAMLAAMGLVFAAMLVRKESAQRS